MSIYSHSTGSPNVDYGIENVTCIGTESNIAECNYTTDHDCYRHESAGVICSPSKLQSSYCNVILVNFTIVKSSMPKLATYIIH